jgi:hypothetical protein
MLVREISSIASSLLFFSSLFLLVLLLRPFISLFVLGHWLMVTKADEVMESLNAWLGKK